MKNWFGMEEHPSDCLIYWNTGRRDKAFYARIEQVRKDWDLLCATVAGKLALARLLQEQHEKSTSEECEAHAGPEL